MYLSQRLGVSAASEEEHDEEIMEEFEEILEDDEDVPEVAELPDEYFEEIPEPVSKFDGLKFVRIGERTYVPADTYDCLIDGPRWVEVPACPPPPPPPKKKEAHTAYRGRDAKALKAYTKAVKTSLKEPADLFGDPFMIWGSVS